MTMKACAAAVLSLVAATSALNLEQSPGKVYPVTRVVELLQDMSKQLQKEMDADEEVYSKLACWCETNDKAKTKAIADAEQHISQLDASIEKGAAAQTTLKLEIESHEKEIEKNEKSLEVATALRKKQKAEFVAEEKEMVQSIRALDAAVTVLSKHHSASLVVSEKKALAEALGTANMVLTKHPNLLKGTISPHQQRMITSLAQQTTAPDYSSATPTFKQAYKPQSGEIFGILKEMRETFETDLSSSQAEEVAAQRAYDDLKVAKENEIAMGKSALADKQEQLANVAERLQQDKQDKEDTIASLGADQKFLLDLKQRCSLTDKEWEERKKARHEEMEAVTEAISILSNDDARDTFSRTFNPDSFVQLAQSAGREDQARKKAQAVLSSAATARASLHSSQIMALSVAAALDPFTKVKKAIDDMVAQLLKEKEEEIKHRDYCIKELNTNELDTEKEIHTKTTLEGKIGGLERTITELKDTIKRLEDEVEELTVQLKRAKEDRALENKQFLLVQADQKETQRVLNEAKSVLERIYAARNVDGSDQTDAPTMLQKSKGSQEPPEGFQETDRHGGGESVVALIQQIINDAKAMQAETEHEEKNAVDAYNSFKTETDASIITKRDAIGDRKTDLLNNEGDLTQAKSELADSVKQLENLADGKGALKQQCDYTLKNIEVRQAARDEEVEALRQAKAFLSGMKA